MKSCTKRTFVMIIILILFLGGCIFFIKKSSGDLRETTGVERCFEDFFNNKISAKRANGTELWNKDLTYDENDMNCYRIGEQVDVDNDGEKEQFIAGLGGGFFLDCRNNQLYIWPEISDSVGDMTYRQIDGEYWIIYMDTLSSNREYYRIIKYKGTEKIEDIEIKKFEVSGNEYEYYINSELSTEEDFLDIKEKYIEK